jgi:hypothetical protein
MEGVGVVHYYEKGADKPVRELITNLNDLRRKIIVLLGPTAYQKMNVWAVSCELPG